MSSPDTVYESSATYYDSNSKSWQNGMFCVSQTRVQFIGGDAELSIPLMDISGIVRRQSSFIYPAIVISVEEVMHWFASFSNRDAACNIVEMFWRESLIPKSEDTVSSPIYRTGGGKEQIMSLLYESQRIMTETANVLAEQRIQIEESQETIEELNAAVDKAEKMLKGINMVRTMKTLADFTKSIFSKDSESKTKRFKITFLLADSSDVSGNWEKGFIVAGSTINVVDENRSKVVSVCQDDVENIEKISPSEFRIIYQADKSTKYLHILCPRLCQVLKHLALIGSWEDKISLKENNSLTSLASPENLLTNVPAQSSSSLTNTLTSPEVAPSNSMGPQIVASRLTNEDMAEIQAILDNLYSLLGRVASEQMEQLEMIDKLISDSNHTQLRIKDDCKKMKKLE